MTETANDYSALVPWYLGALDLLSALTWSLTLFCVDWEPAGWRN